MTTVGRPALDCLDRLRPPGVLLGPWTATANGSAFAAYNVYRRPSRVPAVAWPKIARLSVPNGFTAATIEAQHVAFVDWQPGWHRDDGDAWEDGWDYAITVETTNGLEAIIGTPLTRKVVAAAANAWVTCNAAPWLNSPLQVVPSGKSTSDSGQVVRQYEGRDLAVVRTPVELPHRKFEAGADFFGTVGPDQLRYLRAAEASGEVVSLMRQNSDVVTGALAVTDWADAADGAQYQQVGLRVTETSRDAGLADYNLPAGFALNGTSQYVSTPDNALLKPGTGAFSLVVAGVFPTASGKVHLSKGNGAAGTSFAIRNISGTVMALTINGTNVATWTTPTDAATNPFGHVVSASIAQGAQSVYLDGALIATGTATYTTVTNTAALVAGADNGGASGFSAIAPLRSWGEWGRALTAAEHQRLAYYLLSYPGHRVPSAANALYDARDARAVVVGSTTQVADLSGNALTATKVASPPQRGFLWPLSDVERF